MLDFPRFKYVCGVCAKFFVDARWRLILMMFFYCLSCSARVHWSSESFELKSYLHCSLQKNRLNRFDVFAKTCLTKCVSVAPRMCVEVPNSLNWWLFSLQFLGQVKKIHVSRTRPLHFLAPPLFFIIFYEQLLYEQKTNRRHL